MLYKDYSESNICKAKDTGNENSPIAMTTSYIGSGLQSCQLKIGGKDRGYNLWDVSLVFTVARINGRLTSGKII